MICLGDLSDYCPESPKKSGGGFLQNGGIRESMLVSLFKLEGARASTGVCVEVKAVE